MQRRVSAQRGSRKKRSRALVASTIAFSVLVGYIAFAIQLPEEQSFVGVETLARERSTALNGGDAPQPNSPLVNQVNPIASVLERVLPAWSASTEEFYKIAQKSENQLRLSEYTRLIDTMGADIATLQVQFNNLVETQGNWASESNESMIVKITDQNHAFTSAMPETGLQIQGTVQAQPDNMQWSVKHQTGINRQVHIFALTVDSFCVQESSDQGISLVKFSTDGTSACVKLSEEEAASFDATKMMAEGWEASTQNMQSVFSVSNGKMTVGDTTFE